MGSFYQAQAYDQEPRRAGSPANTKKMCKDNSKTSRNDRQVLSKHIHRCVIADSASNLFAERIRVELGLGVGNSASMHKLRIRCFVLLYDANATVKLNTGADMPMIGMGAFTGLDPADLAAAKDWLLTSLKVGYRHLDTSSIYKTEEAIRDAVQRSSIARNEIFITTKMAWNGHQHVEEFFERSLENLGVDYIDMYLMHWPQCVVYDDTNPMPAYSNGVLKVTEETNFNESYAKMEKLLETGRCKAIGVSNFLSRSILEKLFQTAKVTPAVNQTELHPYLVQEELIKYCRSKGIVIVAYTPTGKEPVRKDRLIVELAKKYDISTTQVILSWHLARGVAIIPKSANEQRQRENLYLPILEPEDVKKISGLDRNWRISNEEYEVAGTLLGWTYEQLGWEGEAKQ